MSALDCGCRNAECSACGTDLEPDDTLQPWEVFDPDDEIIADRQEWLW